MREKTKRVIYTMQYRADAVALYRRSGLSTRRLAADLGMNHWTLYDWIRRDDMKRKRASGTPRAEAADAETVEQKLARLERENERLENKLRVAEQERDFLKKAAAFFARESE